MPRKSKDKSKRKRRQKKKAQAVSGETPWRQLPQLTQGQMPFTTQQLQPMGSFRQALSAPPPLLNPLAPTGVFGGSQRPPEDVDVEYIKTVLQQARKPEVKKEPTVKKEVKMEEDVLNSSFANELPLVSPILKRTTSMPKLEDERSSYFSNIEYSPFRQDSNVIPSSSLLGNLLKGK